MKEALLLDVFLYAGLFLAIAALIIPLLKRFKIPGILGYLVAGIVLGPQGLGEFADQYPQLEYITLQNSENIKLLSELGIVFLLFVIGLELTPRKLWQMRNLVFGLGSAQVLLTASAIGGIAYLWGNSIEASVLLGLGLALSSTAIITQWLHEKKLFNTKAGQTSFSILLLQDLAVIPILLLITIFSAGNGSDIFSHVVTLLLKMVAAVTFIIVIGKYFMRPIFAFSNKYGGAEVFIALSLLVIVISASIAGAAGFSMALGAFIGGLLLAETQYSYEISSIIVPFKSMLLGIFFMAFGMSIDINFIAERPFWLLLSVIGLMAIKSVIIYGLCRLWRLSKSAALESALLLPQAGEFGLLVVGSALTYGFLDNYVGQFMFLTIGLTMLLTPILAPISYKLGRKIGSNNDQDSRHIEKAEIPEEELSGHVVILGYGRMGQTVSETLSKEGIKNIAFDRSIYRLEEGKKLKDPIYFGDATKKSILRSAQIDKASSIILTIDTPASIRSIVRNIREISNEIPIIIRVHKSDDLEELKDKEKIYIVPEYLSASLDIAEKALEYSGYSNEEAHIIAKSA